MEKDELVKLRCPWCKGPVGLDQFALVDSDEQTNRAWAVCCDGDPHCGYHTATYQTKQEAYAALASVEAQEPGQCPNCLSPWKCNGPHEVQPPEENVRAEWNGGYGENVRAEPVARIDLTRPECIEWIKKPADGQVCADWVLRTDGNLYTAPILPGERNAGGATEADMEIYRRISANYPRGERDTAPSPQPLAQEPKDETGQEPADKGPWQVYDAGGGAIGLQSDDFTYDASLKIFGDFGDWESKLSYANWLCATLNAAPPSPLSLSEIRKLAAEHGMVLAPANLVQQVADCFASEWCDECGGDENACEATCTNRRAYELFQAAAQEGEK